MVVFFLLGFLVGAAAVLAYSFLAASSTRQICVAFEEGFAGIDRAIHTQCVEGTIQNEEASLDR